MSSSVGAIARHPQRWAILGVLILSESVVELDATIVNVALPEMATKLHAGTASLQWIVDIYLLIFGGLLLVAGALGDRWGRRLVLLLGLGAFGGASVLASVAPTIGWLIAARAAMGLGAAMILPTTLAILSDVFVGEERVKAFSLWSATAGLSFAIGPTVGGALVEGFGWSAIFLVNVPLVIAAALSCLRVVPPLRPLEATPPDLGGGVLSVAALGALLYAIIRAPHFGWGSSRTLGLFALATLLGLTLILWERRHRHPMIDLRLFRSATFSASTVAIALQFLATAGALFVFTLYLQGVMGHSPLGAGLRLAPVAVALMASALFAPMIERRIGTRLTVALGLSCTTAGLGFAAGLGPDTGYELVAVALMLAGLGGGFAITPAVTAMLSVINTQRAGSSAALSNTAILVGSALGVAILGSLLATGYSEELAKTLRTAPPALVRQAESGIVGAGGPGKATAMVASGAREAFVSAAADTFLIAALISAAGILVALLLMPSRVESEVGVLGDEDPTTEGT